LPLVSIGFAEFRNLPRDSKVFLQAEGLLGGKLIDVQVGSDSDRVYADHDTLQGLSGGGIEEMAEHASSLAERMEAVLADRNLTHVEALLANMDSSAVHLKQTLSENRETLTAVLDTAAVATRDARGMLGENRSDMRQVVENMRRATERLDGVARNMETALESLGKSLSNLNEVSGKLSRGEGTLGRLIHDERLYLDLQRTLTSVDSLIEEIKKDPKRYLNVDLSLF
jgi:phospholipid/cholesterol/gamma-HCH transport system substrate-binding protein